MSATITKADLDQDCRVLALWQPHASLMAWKKKRIETRGHGTKYRGPVIIHATTITGAQQSRDIAECTARLTPLEPRLREPLPFGACVAIGWLRACWEVVGTEPARCLDHGVMRICEPYGQVGPGEIRELGHRLDLAPALKLPKPQGCARRSERYRVPVSPHEEAFGNTGHGRFLWLFELAAEFLTPISHKGLQGLPRAKPELRAKVLERLAMIPSAENGRWLVPR